MAMKNASEKQSKVDNFLRALFGFAGIIIVFNMVIICIDVILRYIRLPSPFLTVEIGGYSLLFITFLGTAWVLKKGEHVRIDLLPSRLSPRNKAILNLFSSSIGALVFLTIAYYAGQAGWHFHITGQRLYNVLRPPWSIFLFTISSGSFLLCVQFIRDAYGHLKTLRSWHQQEERQD
jgi:TRAP-type C4-dicarboxylate transport system permease small subunit